MGRILGPSRGQYEEVLTVGFREASIAFGNIGRDGDCGAVELIDEKAVAAGELLSSSADCIGEVEGFLVDQQLLK